MSTITILKTVSLAIPGCKQVHPNDINDHGQVVGVFSDGEGVTHGFIYEAGAFSQLDYPRAATTNIIGINNNGQMVGVFTDDSGSSGFLYDCGLFGPPIVFPQSKGFTVAKSVNDRGEVAGSYQDADSVGHGFLLRAGGFRSVDYPGASETSVDAINNSGQVIGSFPDSDEATKGFIYLENVGAFSQPLARPGSTVLTLRGINHAGGIVGGFSDEEGQEHPFLYQVGSLHPIDIPKSKTAFLNGINSRGQVVGIFTDHEGSRTPFIATLPF